MYYNQPVTSYGGVPNAQQVQMYNTQMGYVQQGYGNPNPAIYNGGVQPHYYQQQQGYAQPQQTVVPPGVAHAYSQIVQALFDRLNQFLALSEQRRYYATMVLQNGGNNEKLRSLQLDIAEYIDMEQANGRQPLTNLNHYVEHFLSLDACLFTSKNPQMMMTLSPEQQGQVHKSAQEFMALVAILDQRYRGGQVNAYGQVVAAPVYGTMNPYQQQQLYPQQQGYVQPQPYQNGVPGHISQYQQQVQHQQYTTGTYRGTGEGVKYDFVDDQVVDINVDARQTATQADAFNQTQTHQTGHVRPGVVLDEITIPPTGQPSYTNHKEEEVKRVIAAAGDIVNQKDPLFTVNTTDTFLRRKKQVRTIPKVFDHTKNISILHKVDVGDNFNFVYEELIAERSEVKQFAELGVDMNYIDFESEKLVKPDNLIEQNRKPETLEAKTVMSRSKIAQSVEDLLSNIEKEEGAIDGGATIPKETAIVLTKAIHIDGNSQNHHLDLISGISNQGYDFNIQELKAPLIFATVETDGYVIEADEYPKELKAVSSHAELINVINRMSDVLGTIQWSQMTLKLTKRINYLLKAELGLGVKVDSYCLEGINLIEYIEKEYGEGQRDAYLRLYKQMLVSAATTFTKTKMDTYCGIDNHTVPGNANIFAVLIPAVFIPVYAADLAITFAGDRGKLTLAHTPELYNLVSDVLIANGNWFEAPVNDIRMLTLDGRVINVHITEDGDRVIVR